MIFSSILQVKDFPQGSIFFKRKAHLPALLTENPQTRQKKIMQTDRQFCYSPKKITRKLKVFNFEFI